MSAPWNYLPGRLPRLNEPVLVVKGDGPKSFVREAVYTGRGYWKGFGNAPVRAWQSLPHTPICLALKAVLDERDKILDTFERNRTSAQRKRLIQIEAQIELAQQARESNYERFIREAAAAIRIVDGQKF